MDDYMEMDVEIIDNRRGAIEVLNNLWSFGNLQTLRLENCLLEDEDLARIRYEAPKVSYICLCGNRLHSPWNCLVNKFPNVIFLDLTQNTAINDVKRLFPKLIVLNNTQLFELSDGRARSTGGNDVGIF
ncbi:hypothetical protein ANCCAN_29011 [Ancylostoma caninum]|uniref:Leucine Rich repeat-containing domain protein n=1 Tax=Ancylostoma caninum TaxID=29170 RepID=A0A368F0U3_ANCCA|nr:hypothetical protein ANCCAN_29011 [Ancylostoma caninum]